MMMTLILRSIALTTALPALPDDLGGGGGLMVAYMKFLEMAASDTGGMVAITTG